MPESSVEVSYVYDNQHETRRKQQLDKLLNRTPGEVCCFTLLPVSNEPVGTRGGSA
jgi:hypothetical protein